MADANIFVGVKIGESKAQIKSLKDEIKTLGSDFKTVSEEMKYTGTESDKLTEKQKILAAQLKKQEEVTETNGKLWQKYIGDQAASLAKLEEAKKALANAKEIGNADAIDKCSDAVDSLKQNYKSATNNIEKYAKEVEKSQQAEREFEARLNNVNIELEQHQGALRQASERMQVFSDNYRRGAESVQGVTGALSSVGNALTIGVTAPLTAAAAASFAAGQEINKNLANIGTLNVGTDRLKELKTGIQDIAIAAGKDTTDVAEGVYSVISALGDTNDTLEITAINAKSASAGLASTQEAIQLTTAVTKGYNDTTAEATQKVSDLAFETLRLGQTTYSELAASIGKVVPASNVLKISQEELFNVFATLTGVTGGAAEVATQYGAVLTALMKPNEDLAALLDEQGYASGFAAVQTLGFKGTLDMLVNATHGSEEALVDLVGRKEAVTAMFALTGAQADQYAQKLAELQNAAGATDRAFAAQSEGVNEAGFKFQQSMVRMQVAAQGFAESAAPFIESVADKVEGLTTWLSSLNDEERQTIITIAAVVAAVGPVLSVASKLTTVVYGLKGAMAAHAAASTAAAAATTTAGAAAGSAAVGFSALLGPVGLVALAVTGVALAWDGYNTAHKAAIDDSVEAAGKIEQERTAIDDLAQSYTSIASAENLDENARQQLADIQQTLIEQYGIEADGLDLVNGKYEDQIRIINDLSFAKATDEQAKLLAAFKESESFLAGNMNASLNSAGAGVSRLTGGIDGLYEKIESHGNYEKISLIAEGTPEQIQAIYDEILRRGTEYRGQLTKEEIRFIAAVTAENKKLTEEIEKQQEIYNRYMSLELFAGHRKEVEALKESYAAYSAALKSGDTQKIQEQKAAFGEARKALEDLAAENAEYGEAVDELLNAFSLVSAAVDDVDNSLGGAANGVADLTEKVAKMGEAFQTATKNADTLKKAQTDMAKSGKIDVSSFEKIIGLYPEAIAYAGDFAAMTAFVSEKLADQEDAAAKAYTDIVMGNEKAVSDLISQSSTLPAALAAYYDTDVANFKGKAWEKYNEEEKVVQKLSDLWARYADASRSSIDTQIDNLSRAMEKKELLLIKSARGGGSSSEAQKQYQEMEKELKDLLLIKQAASEAESNYQGISLAPSSDSTKSAADKVKREAEAARKAELEKWQAHWKEREELAKNWIDKEKFYNRLSLEDEIAACDRAVVFLKEAKAETAALTFATEAEKANIIKDFATKIESYERQKYTAEKKIKEEEISDTETVASQKEKALQKEIDSAEIAAQKYQAYAALRVEIEKRLTEELADVDAKYWLTEKEKLKEMEAVYESFADSIENIDKKMYELRKERLIEYADEWYKTQKKSLEDSYKAEKDALEKKLAAVKDYYDALDAEEKKADRNKELSELYALEEIYRNAATKEGQDKYKSIVDQIEQLQKEAQREARQEEQKQKEDEITGQKSALDASYKQQQDDLQRQYEQMKKSAGQLAKSTAGSLEAAAGQVTDGLGSIFDAYNGEFDRFQTDALGKVKQLAEDIKTVFRNIDFSFGQSSALKSSAQSSASSSSKTTSVTLNDYGDKNISSVADALAYWAEASNLALYALAKKV